MSVTITRPKRIRSKRDMAHKPSGSGKGRWHSRTSLWAAAYRKNRILRKIRAASRAFNRANR